MADEKHNGGLVNHESENTAAAENLESAGATDDQSDAVPMCGADVDRGV